MTSTLLSTAWRYTKAMPGFIFGTEAELMGKTLRHSYAGEKGLNNGLGFKKFGTQVKDAFEKGVTHHEYMVDKKGGFFKNLWHSTKSTFSDMPTYWKAGGKVADKMGKTGIAKFWKQMVGVGKLLGKRMPLLGAALVLLTELPNIAKTTWNDGLLAGGVETAKTGVRLGCGAVGGAIGTALIPVPLLGSLVGYAVGDIVGRFIVGKSYTEKQEEQKLAQNQTNTQNPFDASQFGGTPISDEEFQKMQMMYMQAANPGNPYSATPQMQQGTGFSAVG